MNTMFLCKDIFWLPSLAAMAILWGNFSASAQVANNPSSQLLSESTTTAVPLNQLSSKLTKVQQFPDATTVVSDSSTVIPVPGTVATSTAALNSGDQESTPKLAPANKVAQLPNVGVGQETRGGSSYIGLAANIGVTGQSSSLDDGSFVVISKLGLTNSISARPSVIISDITTVLIPITYDFSLGQGGQLTEPLSIAPYIGGGAAIKTGNGSETAFLLTGGIDVPLNDQFTATAAINAAFFDTTDVGVYLGIGFNFKGL